MSSIQGGGDSRHQAIKLLNIITENKQTQTAEGKTQIGKMQGRLINAIKSNNLPLIDQTVRSLVKENLQLIQNAFSKNLSKMMPAIAVSQWKIPSDRIFAQGRAAYAKSGKTEIDEKEMKAAIKQANGLNRRNRAIKAKGNAAASSGLATGKHEDRQLERKGAGIGDRLAHLPGDVIARVNATAAKAMYNAVNILY